MCQPVSAEARVRRWSLCALPLLAACAVASTAGVSGGASGSAAGPGASDAGPSEQAGAAAIAPVRDYDDFCQRHAEAYCRRIADCSPDASSDSELCASFTRYQFAGRPAKLSCRARVSSDAAFDGARSALLGTDRKNLRGLSARTPGQRSARHCRASLRRVAPPRSAGPGRYLRHVRPELAELRAGRAGVGLRSGQRRLFPDLQRRSSAGGARHGVHIHDAPELRRWSGVCFCMARACAQRGRRSAPSASRTSTAHPDPARARVVALDDLGTCNARPPPLGPGDERGAELAVTSTVLFVARAGSFWVNDRVSVWQGGDGQFEAPQKQGRGAVTSLPDRPFVPGRARRTRPSYL